MKKLLSIFICIITLTGLILCSCDTAPEETSYAPYTGQTTDTETGSVTTDAETETGTGADTETAPETTETQTEAETEPPEPSPYGMFTFTENKVNATATSPYAILIDANTKEILYINCDPEKKLYPASTTKLLTAIIAIKNCDLAAVFKPGDELELLAPDSSIAYVKKNHELTAEMLIEGMMLPSGGDAAYVLAAGVGRKIAKDETLTGKAAVKVFVDEMNRYGKEVLGLTGSHFTCPDGDHNDDHYSTIIDMMTVAYAALYEPVIMKYAGTYTDDVRYASGHKNTWTNSNKLIDPDSPYFYENATGMKTGTTDQAGCCLIGSAAFSTKKVLCGVFGAKDNKERYNDSRALLVVGINR